MKKTISRHLSDLFKCGGDSGRKKSPKTNNMAGDIHVLVARYNQAKAIYLGRTDIMSNNFIRGVVKKRIFYGQADRKGGGSATPALTVSKCENFDQFFSMK